MKLVQKNDFDDRRLLNVFGGLNRELITFNHSTSPTFSLVKSGELHKILVRLIGLGPNKSDADVSLSDVLETSVNIMVNGHRLCD